MSRQTEEGEDLNAAVVELRVLVLNIRDELEELSNTYQSRVLDVTHLIDFCKLFPQSVDDLNAATTKIQELNDIVITFREQVKMAMDKCIENAQTFNSRSRRQSVVDGKHMAATIKTMVTILDDYQKTNSRLKREKEKLTNDLFNLTVLNMEKDILEDNTTVRKKLKVKLKSESEDSFEDLRVLMEKMKTDLECEITDAILHESSSTEFFKHSDRSLNWYEETDELDKNQWQSRLKELETSCKFLTVYEANITDLKLNAKAVF